MPSVSSCLVRTIVLLLLRAIFAPVCASGQSGAGHIAAAEPIDFSPFSRAAAFAGRAGAATTSSLAEGGTGVGAWELPDAPGAAEGYVRAGRQERLVGAGVREVRPFRSIAVGFTLGIGGYGAQVATPISSKLNLRADASFFSYSKDFVVSTYPIAGHLHLANVSGSVDWAPTAGNFHISPGMTMYDDSKFDATIFVPGGQAVRLEGDQYTSDPNDPIRGTAQVGLGKRVAPRLTVGYGNVIRHRTAGFTFPVEFGFEYIRPPTASFVLIGNACDVNNDCEPIETEPSTKAALAEQQQDVVSELRPLRFYPVFSFGVSYKFGH